MFQFRQDVLWRKTACRCPAFSTQTRHPRRPALRDFGQRIEPSHLSRTSWGRRVAIRSQSPGQQEGQIKDLKAFAATPIFKYWIQGAVFLVVLAGVDAAYSGDWSRIGVISKEFEDSLKPLVIALGVFHVGCAIVAGRAAATKNLNVVPAVLKVLAVGFLAMVEVLAAESRPTQQ